MEENKKFAYVNGSFIPNTKAGLSIHDRGLKFGDGVYETIRIFRGNPFSWEKHMERLAISLKLLKIEARIPNLLQITYELIERNDVKEIKEQLTFIIEGSLRIMITRGIGGVGYLPNRDSEYGIVIEASPLPRLPSDPIDLWVSSYQKIPPQCLPAAAKTMQGLSSTLAKMEAEENNCFESKKPKNIEYESNNICQQVKEMLFAQMEKSCNYLRN